MDKDIEHLVKKCRVCQESRASPRSAPLHPWQWPAQPWAHIHLDFAVHQSSPVIVNGLGQNWIHQQSGPGYYGANDKIRKGQLSSSVTLQALLVIYAVVVTLLLINNRLTLALHYSYEAHSRVGTHSSSLVPRPFGRLVLVEVYLMNHNQSMQAQLLTEACMFC